MFNASYNNLGPYSTLTSKNGLFAGLKGKINFTTILNNTQKTLNIINQAIPVYYQVKPLWNNTKTIFRIINSVKKDDQITTSPINKTNLSSGTLKKDDSINTFHANENSPRFFL